MADESQMNAETNPEMNIDKDMKALLEKRMGAVKRVAGPEPKDLELVARYLDGDLPESEMKRVEARVAADPELREVVARLKMELRSGPGIDADGEKKVVPFQLARPKKKIMPAVIGAAAVLLAAAVVLLVTRPQSPSGQGEIGAGAGGGGLGVSLTAGKVKAEGAQAAWLVSREGVSVLPSDDIGGGFVVPDQHSWCAWIVVADWSASAADDAAKLQGAVTGDKCVIEPIDGLRARLPGVTHLGIKRL